MARLITTICLLCGMAVASWTPCVPIASGPQVLSAPSFIGARADTVWAVYPYVEDVSPFDTVVRVAYTTGREAEWLVEAELQPRGDNRPLEASGGIDGEGRLWVSWFQGDLPVADPESAGIWVATREQTGWQEPWLAIPTAMCPARQSLSWDRAGDWYLGYEHLSPYLDNTYSSALYSRLLGDTWATPRAIGRGVGEPIPTHYHSPTLVPHSSSGVWAATTLEIMGEGTAVVKLVQDDVVTLLDITEGEMTTAAGDSAGNLWVIYTKLRGNLVFYERIRDRAVVDSGNVSEYGSGQPHMSVDLQDWVWAGWTGRGTNPPLVTHNEGSHWTPVEMAGDSAGACEGLVADGTNRIFVLVRVGANRYYSTYRYRVQGVQEPGFGGAAEPVASTVVRGQLKLFGRDPAQLLDLSGRVVADLQPGENDVRGLSPGVYFVRREGSRATQKVIVTR